MSRPGLCHRISNPETLVGQIRDYSEEEECLEYNVSGFNPKRLLATCTHGRTWLPTLNHPHDDMMGFGSQSQTRFEIRNPSSCQSGPGTIDRCTAETGEESEFQ